MTDPIVQPDDIETPAPVEQDVPENDDELDPEGSPVPPENETPEQKDARIAALEERNGKLWARLQREKGKGQRAPSEPAPEAPKPKKSESPAPLTRDEGIVIAKGYSEEELEYAKKVASLEGIKVTDAISHDLFTTWKSKRDAAAKQQQAQLPASRGGRPTVKKSFNTKGLSDEDHRALFDEKLGR